MAKEILKNKKGLRIGYVSRDSKGNATIYDKHNKRLGVVKIDSSGNQTAYDNTSNRMAVYNLRSNVTKDRIGRTIGRGNVLVNLYFEIL